MNTANIRQSLYQCLENSFNIPKQSQKDYIFLCESNEDKHCATLYITLDNDTDGGKDFISFTIANGTFAQAEYANIISLTDGRQKWFKIFCQIDGSSTKTYKYYLERNISFNTTVNVRKELKYGNFSNLVSSHVITPAIPSTSLIEISSEYNNISNGRYVIADNKIYFNQLVGKDVNADNNDQSLSKKSEISNVNKITTNYITVNKDSTLTGKVTTKGGIENTGTITSTGSISTNDSLSVGTTSDLTGKVTTGAGIANTGTITSTGSISTNDSLSVGTTSDLTGKVTTKGGIENTGTITSTDSISTNTSLSVGTTSSFGDKITSNNGIDNTGEITSTGNTALIGDFINKGDLQINDNSNNTKLKVSVTPDASEVLKVDGTSTFTGKVTTEAGIANTGTITSTDSISTNTSLSVGTTSTFTGKVTTKDGIETTGNFIIKSKQPNNNTKISILPDYNPKTEYLLKVDGTSTFTGLINANGNIKGNLDGNATTATKFNSKRTLKLGGVLKVEDKPNSDIAEVSTSSDDGNYTIDKLVINDNAITTSKIADDAVTKEKIAKGDYSSKIDNVASANNISKTINTLNLTDIFVYNTLPDQSTQMTKKVQSALNADNSNACSGNAATATNWKDNCYISIADSTGSNTGKPTPIKGLLKTAQEGYSGIGTFNNPIQVRLPEKMNITVDGTTRDAVNVTTSIDGEELTDIFVYNTLPNQSPQMTTKVQTALNADNDGNGNNIIKTYATKKELNDEVSNLEKLINPGMEFKGVLKITALTGLPTGGVMKGDTYKFGTAFNTDSNNYKVGDAIIAMKDTPAQIIDDTTNWALIPAGDDIEDTWRAININDSPFKGSEISTELVNLKNGSNITITPSGNDITIACNDEPQFKQLNLKNPNPPSTQNPTTWTQTVDTEGNLVFTHN